MTLSLKQINLIIDIDSKAKAILRNGGNETTVCLAMLERMPEIKTIILSVHAKKLQLYLDEYEGFCYYMKSLEKISDGISSIRQ